MKDSNPIFLRKKHIIYKTILVGILFRHFIGDRCHENKRAAKELRGVHESSNAIGLNRFNVQINIYPR